MKESISTQIIDALLASSEFLSEGLTREDLAGIIFDRTDYVAKQKVMNNMYIAQNKALAMGFMIIPKRPRHYIESFSIFDKNDSEHHDRYYKEEKYRLRKISEKQEMREKVLYFGKDQHLINGRPQSGRASLSNKECEKIRSLDNPGMLKFIDEVSRRSWINAVPLLHQL
jgi:hypothetical protein